MCTYQDNYGILGLLLVHVMKNSVDPDQLASSEASLSGSTLFFKHNESIIRKQHHLIEWKSEVHTKLTHEVLNVFLLEYVQLLGQLWYFRPTLIQCGSRSASFIRKHLIRIHPIFQTQ